MELELCFPATMQISLYFDWIDSWEGPAIVQNEAAGTKPLRAHSPSQIRAKTRVCRKPYFAGFFVSVRQLAERESVNPH
jgi:hypothetical protein